MTVSSVIQVCPIVKEREEGTGLCVGDGGAADSQKLNGCEIWALAA